MKPLYAATLALSLAACGGGGNTVTVIPPSLPAPAPVGWQQQFGAGVTLSVKGQTFSFNVPTNPNHVNYVVKAPVAAMTGYKSITVSFGITATSDAAYTYIFDANNTCGGPPKMTLYFQQKGDNGQEDTFRWWAHTRFVFQPGTQTVTIPLDPTQWGSVFGHTASTLLSGWNAALANPQGAGMTFGGGCFDGHGLAMTKGSAVFTLMSYTIDK